MRMSPLICSYLSEVFLCVPTGFEVPVLYSLKYVYVPPRQSLLLISAAVCNFCGQPSDLHSEVAHLLCVCQAERDGYSVFV